MIDEEFIVFGIDASTQREALATLIRHALQSGRIEDEPAVLQAVMDREQEGTTGFGKGIAIPHGKSAGVKEPTLMVGKLNRKVDWNAMDDEPVDTIFLILVPETSHQEHLQMLAKLARRLMHDEFVEGLAKIGDSKTMAEFLQSELQ